MKNVSLGLLIAILICKPTYAADIYDGTLIDAHSQKGKLISVEQLSEKINKTDVDFTLLSFRLKPSKIKTELLEIKQLTGNKVRYLIPTKLFKFTQKTANSSKVVTRLRNLIKTTKQNDMDYVGFGEIIVQHAPHDHKRLKYDGINLDLNSKRISEAIDIVLKDNKPVILHVELNDYETDSKKILNQLVTLSNKNPNNNFLLMHMAQIEFSEAEFIIKNTKNIHFMTSHADNEKRLQMKKKKGQQGWINLFDKDDKLQKKWIDLMNENPKRFVFALDNVWDKQWLRGYKKRVSMWRAALAFLDKKSSVLIACGNANEYFNLGIKCVSER
tara:strand:- start:169 stop:1155 length:987 start_codon:yes stop_codon:yes gene_type:complete